METLIIRVTEDGAVFLRNPQDPRDEDAMMVLNVGTEIALFGPQFVTDTGGIGNRWFVDLGTGLGISDVELVAILEAEQAKRLIA